MNIVKPHATIINADNIYDSTSGWQFPPFTRDDGINLLRKIEWCGRISHRSEDKQVLGSWEPFIKAVVIGHGDWSIVEHASVTVDAVVDRGITHEWVRHRLFSYTQESTRFVNYGKKESLLRFVIPPGMDETVYPSFANLSTEHWTQAIVECETRYREMLGCGCPPQIARSILPNALASRIIVTGNLRNWRHFLIMRTTRESHPQMREVTIPLLMEFKSNIPILFDDIEPLAKQSEGMKRAR